MKTDKELAVELASSYISAWLSRPDTRMQPLSGETIQTLLHDCYHAIQSLDNECVSFDGHFQSLTPSHAPGPAGGVLLSGTPNRSSMVQ